MWESVLSKKYKSIQIKQGLTYIAYLPSYSSRARVCHLVDRIVSHNDFCTLRTVRENADIVEIIRHFLVIIYLDYILTFVGISTYPKIKLII